MTKTSFLFGKRLVVGIEILEWRLLVVYRYGYDDGKFQILEMEQQMKMVMRISSRLESLDWSEKDGTSLSGGRIIWMSFSWRKNLTWSYSTRLSDCSNSWDW